MKRKLTYTKAPDSSLSARDVMPTRLAQERARNYPAPGDQWTEMFSVWAHVDKVENYRVTVRVYSGPCKITPEEAMEDREMSVAEFSQFVRSMRYNGNEYCLAEAGGLYEEGFGGNPVIKEKAK